jgi:ribosomal protein S18 acetylase RimI-like enzyme
MAASLPLPPRLPVRIRPFVPADRAFVLSLAPRLTEGVAPWIGAERMQQAVEQALAADIEAMSETSTILVAEDHVGRRLGFLTIACQRHYTGFTEAYIRNLAVLEQAQRVGVGTTLIDAAVAWTKTQSVEYVGLHTGARNSGARAFYERLGFVEESVKLVKPVSDAFPVTPERAPGPIRRRAGSIRRPRRDGCTAPARTAAPRA